jgi:hypothetical protein
MCCVIKRRTWVLASCTILLLAFVFVGAGCGDSVSCIPSAELGHQRALS